MEYQGVAIAEVVPESIAEEIGLEAGDYLYKINDQIVYDFLDYQYLCAFKNKKEMPNYSISFVRF